jgi:hypothetical protein
MGRWHCLARPEARLRKCADTKKEKQFTAEMIHGCLCMSLLKCFAEALSTFLIEFTRVYPCVSKAHQNTSDRCEGMKRREQVTPKAFLLD